MFKNIHDVNITRNLFRVTFSFRFFSDNSVFLPLNNCSQKLNIDQYILQMQSFRVLISTLKKIAPQSYVSLDCISSHIETLASSMYSEREDKKTRRRKYERSDDYIQHL